MSGTDQSGVSGSSSDKSGTQIAVQKTAAVVQAQAQQATATFRTIGGGQSPQVRVVMPPGATLMPQAMIKQIESNATGVRTQITAIPARTISQTSITVTRPVTPTTYFPRAGATATNIQTQRLATPIRTPTPPTVSALSGNFVRGATVARNSSSPATTVISPTTATWMAGGTGVQLIKAINHQSRQRIVQGITPASTGSTGVVTVGQANIASGQSPQQQAQKLLSGNIQTVTSQQTQQQTYVATLATVLPPRQQTATLVYSNVSNSQAQQFNPSGGAPQRFTVAASLAGTPRQMRPLQIGRQFSATKLGVAGMNTTSISIRSPNIPVLAPTLNTGSTTATLQARSTTGSVNLSTTSLSTTRIIQLQQQQPGTGAQQIMGSTGRIASNLMLQPIIMNTAAGGKIGIRPPTTIAAKVQPSLTITQLGLGKLSATQQQSSNAPTLTAANIQGATITPSSTITPAVTGAIVQQQQQQQSQQSTVGQQQTQQPITQIVSVNPNMASATTGQIITAQNVNVPASATVVPLAITSRATNVLTGTITPIKSTAISVPPIAKVLPQQQQQTQQQTAQHQSQNAQIQSNQPTSQAQQATGLFIHTRPPTSGNASATAAVIPTSGTFLPAGGTFYYESVPTSVPLSTGVLSLTTTTVTSSVSNSQTVTSTNLATGIVSSIPYTPSQGTFTVVPSTARAIGQIQIPVSTSTGSIPSISQIQAVPLRFNTQHACISEQPVSISGQASVAPSSQQQQQQSQQPTQQHQIITMTQTQQPQQATGQQVQQTHMLIPVQASIKLPVTAMTAASPPRPSGISSIGTVNTAFLRKRDSDGSPIRAAKNLAPTLLSMASNTNQQQITCAAVLERSKERERERERDVRPNTPHSRPGSSGGSTTVSANSSPGVDEQMSEEINSMQPMNVRVSNESHFNPINDLYPNHQNAVAPSSVRSQQNQLQCHQQAATSNGNVEPIPRKKTRRSTNDSVQNPTPQLPSVPPSNLQPQQINIAANAIVPAASVPVVNNHEIQPKVNNNNTIPSSNKENTKPTEIIIKKPRTTLLDGYKTNWKANNHFQRYSDVKPREERRPTVMDLANQSHVVQKINGWKIHHLNSQMEDLCEIETQEYEKLGMMLKQLEKHGNNGDIERVSDLIKGNMQRSKIVVDGVNEARTQIMKIFDHKSHVSDIIHRCASKRNFKKREKT